MINFDPEAARLELTEAQALRALLRNNAADVDVWAGEVSSTGVRRTYIIELEGGLLLFCAIGDDDEKAWELGVRP